MIAGVTTDVCVSTTMREANDRGFDCVVMDDGCAATDPLLHDSTLNSIKMEGGIFGSVAKVDDVIHAVENFKATAVRKITPGMTPQMAPQMSAQLSA